VRLATECIDLNVMNENNELKESNEMNVPEVVNLLEENNKEADKMNEKN
jgi:hypothetical protein